MSKTWGEGQNETKKEKFIHFNVDKFPSDYQKYLQREEELLIKFLNPNDNILDIGCGIGRLIPKIAPLVSSYVGIDKNRLYIKEAKNIASKYKNTKVLVLDAINLSSKFAQDTFDKSISTFNTINTIEDIRI